jgi:hypothetical protein
MSNTHTDSFFIDVTKDLDIQMTNIKESDSNITINKMISIEPIVRLLQKNFPSKDFTITCMPYKGDALHDSNAYKYSVVLNKHILEMYINNKKIDTSQNRVEINYRKPHHCFVLDIFRFFDNVTEYFWKEKAVCNFHKNGDSAMYGIPSGSYIRVKQDIVNVISDGCCCDYSGGESFFNIKTNKLVYQSCGCFINQCDIDRALGTCSCADP